MTGKLTAAAFGAIAALAIGITAHAGAYDPSTPDLTASLSCQANATTYTVVGSVDDTPAGDQAVLAVALELDNVYIFGTPTAPHVIAIGAQEQDIWSRATQEPESGIMYLALYVQNGNGWLFNGSAKVTFPDAYVGAGCPVPTPTAAPTQAPTAAPTAQPTDQATPAPTDDSGNPAPTDSGAPGPTDTPAETPTAAPTDAPLGGLTLGAAAVPSPPSSGAVAVQPVSQPGTTPWLILGFIGVAFLVFAGSTLGAFLRRR